MAVTLTQIGEDRLVEALTRGLPLGSDVRVGPGDDCAVIGSARARHWQLLKTDVVIEGIHFLPGEDARRVGWKALCRAISDIAAMGGLPQHALITVAAAKDVELAWMRHLYSGLKRAARKFGVSIVGGETSRSPGPLFLNIALTGSVERSRCVLRSGGQPGDLLFVTGRLGGSLAGKHLDFMPRLAQARWLVSHFPLHAMMDLSDGLGADLPRLASASRCGFSLEPSRLPLSKGASPHQALHDGEDFELLFALAPAYAPKLLSLWKKQFPRLPLTQIGSLTEGLHFDPRELEAPATSPLYGFDHFAESR